MKRAAEIQPEALVFFDIMRAHFGPTWTLSRIAYWVIARARSEGMSPFWVSWAQGFIENARATAGDWED